MSIQQTKNVNPLDYEQRFYRALGNGEQAGLELCNMIRSVMSSRDTTVLVRAIRRAEDKKDQQAANVVRFVVRHIWPAVLDENGATIKAGAKVGKDKNGLPVIKISGVGHDDMAFARLEEAVERKLSIRHKAFRNAVQPPVEDGEEQEFDYVAWAKRALKQHPDGLETMIAALQALRKEQEEKK